MFIIYLKEMIELLRDRKTLYFTVIIPVVILPLAFFGFGYVSTEIAQRELNGNISYAIVGASNSKELVNYFFQEKSFNLVDIGPKISIEEAINSGFIKFVLDIPKNFDADSSRAIQVPLTIHYNGASSGETTLKRVNTVIDSFNSKIRNNSSSALGLDLQNIKFILKPVQIKQKSIASDRERIGSVIGGLLPYFLLIVCLMSSMYPAIDLGAGEKERGTLESLLLAPISRKDLVMAKFLVLFTFGTFSATIMVFSLWLLLQTFGMALDPDLALISSELRIADYLMIEFMLMPTAAVFSSILLSISIYAKDYKEASGFMQPMVMFSILPIVLAVIPGVQLGWFWSLVPLTNVSLAMKEIVKGTMDYRMFITIFLSTTCIASVLLLGCRWWFDREEVLFRD